MLFNSIFFKFLKIFSLSRYITRYKKKKFKKNLLKTKSIEERFNKIYSTNYWLDDESRSGTGSSLRSTENIRFHLPKILEKFNIKKLFDAPCGDFNWMSQAAIQVLQGFAWCRVRSPALQNFQIYPKAP